jgi:lysozyme family protein/peptidoglycan hydrolase-like protein with peptidoglycan-binding domain
MSLRLRAEPTSTSGSTATSTETSTAGPSNALAAASTPAGDGLTQDQRAAGIGNATRRQVYDSNRADVADMNMDLSQHQWASERFTQIWTDNRERYERVAAQTGVPAELIAAIHFRESSGNFNTYLHNGQPLGRRTTIVPVGVLFHDWEEAAVDALNSKSYVRDDLQMTAETTDMAAIATYAEYYNGLGYHYRDRSSAYVFAGTDQYTSGKFVADGVFDPNVRDQQLGVVAMVQLAQQANGETTNTGTAGGQTTTPGTGQDTAPPASTGGQLAAGANLRRGSRGASVTALQSALNSLGHNLVTDGDFGPATESAVKSFQRGAGLVADGIVGPMTRTAINQAIANNGNENAGTGAETETAPEAAAPPPTSSVGALIGQLGTSLLRMGSNGSAVRALQQILNSLGHSLVVDGAFGRLTDGAVRAFQRGAGLVADGIVGSQTRNAFNGGGGGTTAEPDLETPEPGSTAPNDPRPAPETERPPGGPTTAEGDTDIERRLDTFFQAFNGIPIRTNPGQSPPNYVDVIPPYHINAGHRKDGAAAARRQNSSVASLVSSLPVNARFGKASPADIRYFLETSIQRGYLQDTSANGMRDFLALYGVSTDCSGLVTQALNYLNDGNLDVDDADGLNPMYVGSGSLRGGTSNFAAVSSPHSLTAGDTMHIPGHIRILVDVDREGDVTTFRTIESTPREDVVEPGQRDAADRRAADGGIGDVHWRYNANSFSGLQRSYDGGRTWHSSRENPTYGRYRHLNAA